MKEFSAYANRQNISFDENIKNSTFETNHFLYYPSGICLNIIGKIYFNLVECTAFFGSISITNYMRINWEVELTPFMWLSAIHSQNTELIKYLEDNHIPLPISFLIRKKNSQIKYNIFK